MSGLRVCARCWTDSSDSDFKGPRLCLQCWAAEQKVDPVLDEAVNAALEEGFDP